jgi:hypothetical protein
MPTEIMFSDVTIPSEGAGSASRFAGSIVASGLSTAGPLTPESVASSETVSTFVESANTVYKYGETIYDSELKDKGITSAYPVILGTVPFTNIYKNESLTNYGQIFQIQNDLRDVTVTIADQIVSNFYLSGGNLISDTTESSALGGFSATLSSSPGASAFDDLTLTEYGTTDTSTAEETTTDASSTDSSTLTAPSGLSQIRDSNNEKYNNLISYLPKVVNLRNSLINAAENTVVPSSENLGTIIYKGIGTSLTEIANAYGSEYDPSSADTAEFNNLTVEYVDDDVSKYDTGTKSLLNRHIEKFIGDTSSLENSQYKTALHYQVAKAALFQMTEGISLSDIEDYGYTSPYRNLDYQQIASVEKFREESSNFSMKSDLKFAKATLSLAAEIIDSDYAVPSGKISGQNIPEEMEKYGVHHKGQYVYDSDGNLIGGAKAALAFQDSVSGTYLNSQSYYRDTQVFDNNDLTFLESVAVGAAAGASAGVISDPLTVTAGAIIGAVVGAVSDVIEGKTLSLGYKPVVSVLKDTATAGFIKQIPTVLAYKIMEDAGNSKISSWPKSISPSASDSVDVEDTIGNDIRYIFKISNNQTIAPFDTSFPEEIGKSLSPISSVLLYGDTALDEVSDGLSDLNDRILSFASDNKAVLTNQCALTILKVFYEEFSGYFKGSVFGGNTGTGSLIRTLMFLRASENDTSAAVLYRAIHKADLSREVVSYDSEEYNSSFAVAMYQISTGQSYENLGGEKFNGLEDLLGKVEIDPYKDTQENVYNTVFNEVGNSFQMFNRIVETLVGIYPTIGTSGTSGTRLAHTIRMSAYTMFLYFLRLIRTKAYLDFVVDSDDSDIVQFVPKLEWDKEVTAMLVACFDNAFVKTELDSESDFSYYEEIIGSTPAQEKIDTVNNRLFKYVRSPVKNAIQVSQDVASLFAYQKTIIENQIDIINEIKEYYSKITEVFDGDSERATLLISRYLTPESIVEMLYKAKRYQSVIPGTGITEMITRSASYRSIVETVFKNIIPNRGDLGICVVGIPYGHLERLRLARATRNRYFGIQTNVDDVRTSVDDENDVTYPFKYIENSSSQRPDVGGPFDITIANIYDDFSSTTFPTSIDDDSISLAVVDGLEGFRDSGVTNATLTAIARSSLGSSEKNIDLRAYLVQAALQSYIEDIYGLYFRYASTKSPMRTETYPEEIYAESALANAGYTPGTPEQKLEYARLKSAIMMHKDFATTRMLEELEASPVFDKIVYILYKQSDLGNILNEFYTKVKV